jgi:hypothetical protein
LCPHLRLFVGTPGRCECEDQRRSICIGALVALATVVWNYLYERSWYEIWKMLQREALQAEGLLNFEIRHQVPQSNVRVFSYFLIVYVVYIHSMLFTERLFRVSFCLLCFSTFIFDTIIYLGLISSNSVKCLPNSIIVVEVEPTSFDINCLSCGSCKAA